MLCPYVGSDGVGLGFASLGLPGSDQEPWHEMGLDCVMPLCTALEVATDLNRVNWVGWLWLHCPGAGRCLAIWLSLRLGLLSEACFLLGSAVNILPHRKCLSFQDL